MPEPPKIKTTNEVLPKCELAALLNFSSQSLNRLLNEKYYKELEQLGYKKDQKLLLPQQLNYLFRKLDITEDE